MCPTFGCEVEMKYPLPFKLSSLGSLVLFNMMIGQPKHFIEKTIPRKTDNVLAEKFTGISFNLKTESNVRRSSKMCVKHT